jgi:hypothetical protein
MQPPLFNYLDAVGGPMFQGFMQRLLYLLTLVKSTLEMATLSTARKLSILARVAVQQAGRTRTFGALLKAGRTTAAHFARVLGQLWLEVTGFVFLVLSGIGALACFREYAKYQARHTSSGRVLLAIAFTVTFAWFGVSSFWRVQKKK